MITYNAVNVQSMRSLGWQKKQPNQLAIKAQGIYVYIDDVVQGIKIPLSPCQFFAICIILFVIDFMAEHLLFALFMGLSFKSKAI